MSGLRIAHYVVDVGYIEPTRVYAVVELDSGDLRMDKIYEARGMTLEELPIWYRHLEVKRPVVLADYHPRVAEVFKSAGIRVR